MSVKVELLLDSESLVDGSRLSTFKIEVPLAAFVDLATHRLFSKNASSSRAIPLKKWRENALKDPAIPTTLTKFNKGMEANEVLEAHVETEVRSIWHDAVLYCSKAHQKLEKLGLSKQDANVLLYQFSHVQVILSSTRFSNFFNLRCHSAAKPDVRLCAELMQKQLENSEPTILIPGEWHTPLVSPDEKINLTKEQAVKISTARCARVSYFIPATGKVSTLEEDLGLHDRLVSSGHFSPLEHVATPFPEGNLICGNYIGWLQYRKLAEPLEVEELPIDYKFVDNAQAKKIAEDYGIRF